MINADTPEKIKRKRQNLPQDNMPDLKKRAVERVLPTSADVATVSTPARAGCSLESLADKITKLPDEHIVLSRLFGALDLVMLLLHGRRRATLTTVRTDVEIAIQ